MARREPSIEDQRAEVVRQLEDPGIRRIEVLQELAELDAHLRPLVAKAVSLGVTTRRIGELVGLTSAGVSIWARKQQQP